MARVEVTLPDRMDTEIDQLVQSGEFLNREEAYETLISMGVSAYDTSSDSAPELDEEMFSQTFEDQQDPAIQDDGGEERTF